MDELRMARSSNSTKAPPKARGKGAKAAKPAPSSPAAPGASYVGKRVSKDFDGEVYSGTVKKYFPRKGWWNVVYDDGDKEDMEWEDLEAAMDLFDSRNKKGGKGKKGRPKKATAEKGRPKKAAETEEEESEAKEVTPTLESDEEMSEEEDWSNVNVEPKENDADVSDEEDDEPVDAETGSEEEAPMIAHPMVVTTDGRTFGRVDRPIRVDTHLFRRNPCRIPGGTNRDPSDYPNYDKEKGSFGFLIQRLSDRNYAMRAHCLEGAGAEYTTYRKEDAGYISVVWFPPSNYRSHAHDESIVDGTHLDLIDPNNGRTYLTGAGIAKAIDTSNRPVECVFLNGAQSNAGSQLTADGIAKALSKCRQTLRCVSLTECVISTEVLEVLASCTNLSGLLIENCQLDREDKPNEVELSAVLASCPDLRWLFVKSSLFAEACWDVLAMKNAAPKLEVLWIDAPKQTRERADVARGDHGTICAALEGRAGTLKLCMVNPDSENKSRYVIGGGRGTNRLAGRERSKEEKVAMEAEEAAKNEPGYTPKYLTTV
ncbi:hypothetical protein ACHAXT_011937 [Thalassiosira profunda]